MTIWRTAMLAGLALAATVRLAVAAPAASDWAREEQAQVRLLTAQTAVGTDGVLRLGVEFKIAPGWKTYWRTPGDAGFPLRVDWSASRNLADPTVRWPAPERFTLFGLDTFGYGGEVVFPIDARAARPGEAVVVDATLDYLVCEKICIPFTAHLALDVPAGKPDASEFAHTIDRFAVRVPGDGSAAGLRIERAEWRGGSDPEVVVTATAREPLAAPDLFVEGPAGWTFGRPAVRLLDGGRQAELTLPARPDVQDGPQLAGQPVRLTLVEGERSAERSLTLEAGMPAGISWMALLAILGVALIGGMILNLMPCVLPVLGLKLLSVVGMGQAERRVARSNFAASAAGILAAFIGLAAALNGLKAAGVAIGWGIQFQSPIFLAFMVLVLTVFAANLWGWFEVGLPTRLAGAVPQARDGPAGAFITGVFATLLATPCSAPFVGTAVSFALSRGAVETYAVFAALGLGLATPYLLVAALPGLATLLPRPGPWMPRLRAILGGLLVVTALWLLAVMAAGSGWMAAGAVGALAVLGLAVLGLGRRLMAPALRWSAVAVVAVAALAAPLGFNAPASGAAPERLAGEIEWRPFDLASLRERVIDAQVVLVDVTAEWCLTCRVNKALVLTRGKVGAALADGSVIAVRADWTRPDERISAYLASFGRYGIPFNAVYGPGAPNGIALPELLTADAVLDAVARARGGR